MTPEERRQFVLDHGTGIFGYNRANDGPAMSIVFYAATPEEIVVSTMAERAKAKAVARSPKVSLSASSMSAGPPATCRSIATPISTASWTR